jgi:hypothetical protein
MLIPGPHVHSAACGHGASPALAPRAVLARPAALRLVSRAGDAAAAAPARRTRLWELAPSLHCSIVGTCMSAGELRRVLQKLQVQGAAESSDHDLHTAGVTLAARRDSGRFLHKALDRLHRAAIARYAAADTAEALLACWQESLRRGDVPGAYWALLTHPRATETLVQRAFGDVHMLSHLMGAANRADIRRLRQLEEDNAALQAKVERQQQRLRDGFVERDATIARLSGALARQPAAPAAIAEPAAGGLVDDLTLRLSCAGERCRRAEDRVGELTAALAEAQAALAASRDEVEAGRRDLAAVERRLADFLHPDDVADAPVELAGQIILYVGGRPHQVAELRRVVEHAGGRFLHHDGGIDDNVGLLPGLVSRADRVFFPVDCVSHDAVGIVKRACRQLGRDFQPLRTASLAALLAALASAQTVPA